MSSVAAALPRDELVLGRYRPVQPLGSGGSGSVWLARDELEGGEVTLKIVPREGKAAQRAEREAEAAHRLDHERCLKARDFGTDPEHSYIAYEYVPGETFRHALRAGRMDDGTTVEAGAQILEGLAHAHGLGIVHRDIKPSNVLMADDEDGVSVRLLDFGLALFDEADTLTAAGDVPGTLAYISPERLKGQTAGPAADVWAVGVLLWEALAGFHPYWTSSMLDTAKKIQEAPPSLGTVRPDLPSALIEVVDRAMCRDPRKRPTATRMAAAVRSAWRSRQRRRRPKKQKQNLRFRTPPLGRVTAVGLAAIASGWVVATLPFFPGSWALIVAAVAAGLTLIRDRAGLAFTLATPILPLGNVSMGLALAYMAAAGVWLAIMWGEPRRGLVFAAGPLLAPLSLVGLLPLVSLCIKSPLRRAATAGIGVLTAVAVTGIAGESLPFAHEEAPSRLPLFGTESPREAASIVLSTLQAHPVTLVAAAIAALAAAALPVAVRKGYAGIAGYGVTVVAVSLASGVGMAAVPAVCATALTCIALATARYLRDSDVPLSQLLATARERVLGGLEPATGRVSAD